VVVGDEYGGGGGKALRLPPGDVGIGRGGSIWFCAACSEGDLCKVCSSDSGRRSSTLVVVPCGGSTVVDGTLIVDDTSTVG